MGQKQNRPPLARQYLRRARITPEREFHKWFFCNSCGIYKGAGTDASHAPCRKCGDTQTFIELIRCTCLVIPRNIGIGPRIHEMRIADKYCEACIARKIAR